MNEFLHTFCFIDRLELKPKTKNIEDQDRPKWKEKKLFVQEFDHKFLLML